MTNIICFGGGVKKSSLTKTHYLPGDGGEICEGTEKEGLNYTTY